ncbi:MFS transporter [Chitinibacter sp. ZOR0017]|uniref:MFS transporter n=1 Tax=Chitinibacter sp. ZOR0017 TaxID=1339254 RepID=UPI0009DDA368|nr:MFS transporter [Chitinibacter sp. ZOR0017]
MPRPMNARQELGLLLVLMLVMFTCIADFMIMMPLASYLMAELKISTAQFGLLVSAYSLAAGASSLLASSQADRFDRRHSLLGCYAGLIVATLACGLATDFHWLLLARVLAGIFGGVLGSICMAIVGDVIPPERRGQAMSWVMLGFSLSAVAGVPLGLWLAAHAGWRLPFYALAGICVVVLLAALVWVPPVRGHLARLDPNANWLDNYRELLADTNHWWAVGLTAMLMVSGFLVIPFIAPTMIANSGIAQSELMFVYLVGGAGTIFSRPLIGRLSDRYPKRHVVAALIVLSFLPIVLVTQSFHAPLGWHLAISLLFFVFVSGRFIPATALVTGATRPHLRGRLMAFNSAVQNFASGCASLLAGLIITQQPNGYLAHYGWVGLLSCLAGLVGIWIAARIKAVS